MTSIAASALPAPTFVTRTWRQRSTGSPTRFSTPSRPEWASEDAIPSLSMEELRHLVREGAQWTLRHGYATQEDLDQTEEGGRLPMAQPEKVSEHAYQRGRTQLGTLGSGNHFLEVSRVDQIYQPRVAEALGLELGQVTLLIHSGSPGSAIRPATIT